MIDWSELRLSRLLPRIFRLSSVKISSLFLFVLEIWPYRILTLLFERRFSGVSSLALLLWQSFSIYHSYSNQIWNDFLSFYWNSENFNMIASEFFAKSEPKSFWVRFISCLQDNGYFLTNILLMISIHNLLDDSRKSNRNILFFYLSWWKFWHYLLDFYLQPR